MEQPGMGDPGDVVTFWNIVSWVVVALLLFWLGKAAGIL